MIWFGAEQVNPLCGVTQCVNTLQKDDQYAAQAGLVSRLPQVDSVIAFFYFLFFFQHFYSKSRHNF